MTEAGVDRVRVFQGADGQWYYETEAGNGQVLETSEGYSRKHDALRAAWGRFGTEVVKVEASS